MALQKKIGILKKTSPLKKVHKTVHKNYPSPKKTVLYVFGKECRTIQENNVMLFKKKRCRMILVMIFFSSIVN